MTPPNQTPTTPPPYRRLRVYALDPSLQTDLDTAAINLAVLKVPWERNPAKDGEGAPLEPGPVGEYIEVVDVDPASGCFYQPVDLNDPDLLAQDGLTPSEGNPQFHQQMVYAVAMTTIRNFENALGRLMLWAPRRWEKGLDWDDLFVQRLRIYPHALREANAYYSPAKKSLLFGYFPASVSDAREHLPHGTVFTCLSHDIVAHETTHALLDGLHRRFIEPTNPDVLTFHEGFADIVAIFQHFTMPEVLRHQIARMRGDLSGQSLLAQLALQFGRATGRHGGLRDALGGFDAQTKHWQARPPDPTDLDKILEPHARGAILVAAVFDAFLIIYKARIADLLRIATHGSGILPQGALHPDLVKRLADEAATTAQHVLTMCIRALDYCPPVDITFGEYLRALITADRDLVADDDHGYRAAVISAFQRRGIYPHDVRTLSVESLCWQAPSREQESVLRELLPGVNDLRKLTTDWTYPPMEVESLRDNGGAKHNKGPRLDFVEEDPGAKGAKRAARVSSDRRLINRQILQQAVWLHRYIDDHRAAVSKKEGQAIGLDLSGMQKFEVHSVRPARRYGPDGQTRTELVVVITQRDPPAGVVTDFVFRGGCTLLIDPETGEVRYCIVKNITSTNRRERQRKYREGAAALAACALGFGPEMDEEAEPFALLHRSQEEENWS